MQKLHRRWAERLSLRSAGVMGKAPSVHVRVRFPSGEFDLQEVQRLHCTVKLDFT
jgi:hypothetical protein